MIKYAVRKKLFNFLVLGACLVMSASFAIAAKTYSDKNATVSIEQQDASLNILVKAPKNTSVQFYMFSTDGNLIKQMEITGIKKFSIGNLSKGTYLYELFDNDERLTHGDIRIK